MATTPDKITASSLQAKKERSQKISMLTAYDHPTALLQDAAGIDVVFVGDSVGTNVLGYRSPQQVTMDDILHHLRAVRRAVRRAFLLADLPFMSYQPSVEIAVKNAGRLVQEGGAEGVKLEGGLPVLSQVRAIGAAGILEDAGVFALVLELVTEEAAQVVAERLEIPVIGIGAGRYCDGQVLIVHDLVGLNEEDLVLAKAYGQTRQSWLEIFSAYRREVEEGRFPTAENVAHMDPEKRAKLDELLKGNGQDR